MPSQQIRAKQFDVDVSTAVSAAPSAQFRGGVVYTFPDGSTADVHSGDSIGYRARYIRYKCLLVSVAWAAASCSPVRDEFPMRNAATGQQVTCYSGYYWFEEGLPQLRIALQCRSACERHGFVWQGGNEYYKPNPEVPDEDMKQFIPAACLP